MATAKKKAAPKAAVTLKKVIAPAKVVKSAPKAAKPVAKVAVKKAPVSKTALAITRIGASIAKLTERKDKLNAEIVALREKRAALKVTAAPVAPMGKTPPKAAPKAKAPAKAVSKPAAKK